VGWGFWDVQKIKRNGNFPVVSHAQDDPIFVEPLYPSDRPLFIGATVGFGSGHIARKRYLLADVEEECVTLVGGPCSR